MRYRERERGGESERQFRAREMTQANERGQEKVHNEMEHYEKVREH